MIRTTEYPLGGSHMLNRRSFISSIAASGLAAPAIAQEATEVAAEAVEVAPQLSELELRPLPVADPGPLDPQLVSIPAGFRPGDIHVDPNIFRLFFVLPNNQAIRYAVGVGRVGLYEPGVFRVGAKREWPSWTPTPEMIEREPEHYEQYADGVPGGPDNPLGARALYLYTGTRDTDLRILGTNAPRTIGSAVSNGCARLVNDYVIDLYARVNLNSQVYLYNRV
jgi:lipoprotein-anchoring transpeptidase ErfK/SrfK